MFKWTPLLRCRNVGCKSYAGKQCTILVKLWQYKTLLMSRSLPLQASDVPTCTHVISDNSNYKITLYSYINNTTNNTANFTNNSHWKWHILTLSKGLNIHSFSNDSGSVATKTCMNSNTGCRKGTLPELLHYSTKSPHLKFGIFKPSNNVKTAHLVISDIKPRRRYFFLSNVAVFTESPSCLFETVHNLNHWVTAAPS